MQADVSDTNDGARVRGLASLPGWPRHLTRELAAAYVGVSVSVFDDEVRQGVWPPPRRRGAKGGKHTWDRLLLDRASDALLPPTTGALPPIVRTPLPVLGATRGVRKQP